MAEHGKFRWQLAHLLALAWLYFCSAAFLMQFPRYILAIGGTAQDAGWLLALGLFPALLLGGWIGEWNRSSGGRSPLVWGALLTVACNLGMLWVKELSWGMLVLRLVYAVGHTCIFVSLFAQAGLIGDNAVRRASAIGWLAVAIQLGNAVGGTLGEWAYLQGASLYWLACSAIGAAALLLAGFWQSRGQAVPQASADQPIAEAAPARWPVELWATIAVGMAFSALSQFLPAFIDHLTTAGALAEPFAAAWFITPALLVVAAVRVAGGFFAARLLRPWVLGVCHGLLLLTLLAVPWMHTREQAIALALLFGLGYGWLYPALNALAINHAAPEQRGRIAGWLVAAFEIGFRLSPLGLGAVITWFGYSAMFHTLVFGYLAFLAIGSLWKRVRLQRGQTVSLEEQHG